jgi:hypothetical protein
LALVAFHRLAASVDGRQSRCKDCACRLTREWAERNPLRAKATQRAKYLRRRDELRARATEHYRANRDWVSVVTALRRYGLTLDQYHAMQERQDFACAICGDDGKLTVDHDHQCCKGNGSGKNTLCGKCNRGLLCANCNNGLGCFKDSPALLASAASYLAAQ